MKHFPGQIWRYFTYTPYNWNTQFRIRLYYRIR